MFIADALLGNFDRHNGNRGFLYDDCKGEAEIAPIFDCGSCLLSQADDKVMRQVLGNESELHARIFQFPTSAVKLHGCKINYYDFLNRIENKECRESLKRITPRINLLRIENFINQVPGISDLQKEFYKKYINSRYSILILSAFESATVEG